MRRSRLFIVLVLVLVAGAALTLPYKMLVEKTLKDRLSEQGITNISFKVDGIRPDGIVLTDILIAAENPISIDKVTADFSLWEVISGNFKQLNVSEISFNTVAGKIIASDLAIAFTAPSSRPGWKGSWTVGSLLLRDAALPVPPLSGAGDFTADKELLKLKGEFKDAQVTHKAVFSVDYSLAGKIPSVLNISSVYLPWNSGVISASRVSVPLVPRKAFQFTLNVQRVSLDALMALLTGGRATASGVVTGAIPVGVDERGNIAIRNAQLSSEKSGIITLAPDAIPGDNEQVELVRSVLKNFHYTLFSVGLASDENKKLSILLQLLGNNPDVYNGKEVKLNVRLNGDLLNLLKQNIMPIADPTQYLKQGDHEK